MNLTSILAKPRSNTLLKNTYCVSGATNTKDRVKGVLIGLAAADRIGGPTRMALALANSLIVYKSFNADDVTSKYLDWYQEDGFDTGVVCNKVFQYSVEGIAMPEAVLMVDKELGGKTAGCNPLHRNAVIPMLVNILDSEVPSIVIKESSLTHKHHLASQVASSSAELIRMLINGVSWEVAVVRLENLSSPVISKVINNGLKGNIRSDGYSPHVFSAAIHFVNSNNSFDEMLMQAIDFAGDENYCAVLAGSLGGARWGESSISSYWLKGSNLTGRVQDTALKLSKDW